MESKLELLALLEAVKRLIQLFERGKSLNR
jgi:hypothetical protein